MIKKINKDDNDLLDSFNELTRNTFGFDFTGWHAAGHFSDMYVPHVLLDKEKVVSHSKEVLILIDDRNRKCKLLK